MLKGKNKGKLSVLIILLLSIVLGFFTYVIVKDQQKINQDVLMYLEEKGVNIEEDISNLEIVNVGEEDKQLAVVVTYREEPDVDYLYTYDQEGEIYEMDRIEK